LQRSVLAGAARRLLGLALVVIGGTALLSLALGALSGKNLARSIAVGFYVVGAVALFLCFLLGSWGPVRRRSDDASLPAGPLRIRPIRKATPEERVEARRSSLGLFVLGLVLVLIGVAIDPTRHAF